jgi:hypothetical protein
MHMRLGKAPGTVLEHLNESGLIQSWVGVWGTDESCDTARHSRLHLRLEGGTVFEPWFTQPRAEVYEPWRNALPRQGDGLVCGEAIRPLALRQHGNHAAFGQKEISGGIQSRGRVNHTASCEGDPWGRGINKPLR